MNRILDLPVRIGPLTLGLVLLATTLGCASPSYIMVQSRLVESTRPSTPEITPTPQYSAALGHVRNVAVRAPDNCANERAATITGAADARGPGARGFVIATYCGVEMAELERALTRAGYVVYSWKMIANISNPEGRTTAEGRTVPEGHLTPVEAAKRLGAQVLFQVNSLERALSFPGRDARWERTYYNSDAFMTPRGRVELPEQTISVLRNFIQDDERKIFARERLGAMLDVNAVMVDTGQTTWFYRWNKTEPSNTDTTASALAMWDRNLDRWVRTTPARENGANQSMLRSSEIEAISVAGRSESERDAIYFQLVREVVSDFVDKFARGDDASAAPAMSPPPPPGSPPPPSLPPAQNNNPAPAWTPPPPLPPAPGMNSAPAPQP